MKGQKLLEREIEGILMGEERTGTTENSGIPNCPEDQSPSRDHAGKEPQGGERETSGGIDRKKTLVVSKGGASREQVLVSLRVIEPTNGGKGS